MSDDKKKPENLMEGLLNEILRIHAMSIEYRSIPSGAGNLGAAFMDLDIATAKRAIVTGDTIQMMVSYEKLKEYEY